LSVQDSAAEQIARAQGFERLADLFPEEVAAAARQAARQREQLGAPENLSSEPWPVPPAAPPA
jgi:hypothetical protein